MFQSILVFVFSLVIFHTSHASEKLVITGSSTIAPVVSDLAKIYENKHQNVRIDVQTGGTSRGFLDVTKGLSQVGMVSRALKDSEKEFAHFTFAKDGLAIIVHKTNSVKELTEQQIVDIYTGKVTNWQAVGGVNKKIVVVNKAEGRSTLELFLKFFDLKNSAIKADVIIGDNEQGIKTVSQNPLAIAYVSIGAAEYNASIGVPLKLLKFRGVAAKVENIANGTYPLKRDLNLVTKGPQDDYVKNFVKYVMSSEAHSTIKDHYFVPTNAKQ